MNRSALPRALVVTACLASTSLAARSRRADAGSPQSDAASDGKPIMMQLETRKEWSASERQRSAFRLRRVRARLQHEVHIRDVAQAALAESDRALAGLAAQTSRLEERLRNLCRRLLTVRDAERLQISFDLHEAIGENLAEINVGLARLLHEATTRERAGTAALRKQSRDRLLPSTSSRGNCA